MRRGAFRLAGIALLVTALAAALYAAKSQLTSEQVTDDVDLIQDMADTPRCSAREKARPSSIQ